MKTIGPVALVIGLIGVATLWAQTTPSNQKNNEALEARIKALEERVTSLERLTARTTAGPANLIAAPSQTNSALSSFLQVPPAPAPNPRWKPFQFNNETYYFVPLSQNLGTQN